MGAALRGIDVVVLFVADLNRSKAFYRETLGLPMRHEDQNSAFFALEGASLLLLGLAAVHDLLPDETTVSPHPAGASSQLVASVDDVDTVYADLLAKGVTFVAEPVDRWWGLRTAHFKDPDGNIWEINQPMGEDASKDEKR